MYLILRTSSCARLLEHDRWRARVWGEVGAMEGRMLMAEYGLRDEIEVLQNYKISFGVCDVKCGVGSLDVHLMLFHSFGR